MAKYVCGKCKYKFVPKGGACSAPPRCPWCGTSNTVSQEQSASELLTDLGGFE
ncbi:MAG TPA: hypothetical protein VJG31_01010 [Candidatus Nanoarchaeia archaeon]|nr:hypothetical protein [Candidatus Nanoarchaeia archaeon]